MTLKTNNTRTCIATGKKTDKSNLIRIVKQKNKISIDTKQKLPGRGCYITKDPNLADKLLKQKLLHKAFKTQVDNRVYEELIKILKEV